MQSRWKSKMAWMSLASLIVFLIKTYFDVEIDEVDRAINMIFATLTAFGIFNNPTDGRKY